MARLLQFVAMLVISGTAAACGAQPDGAGTPVELEGTWQLESGSGPGGDVEPPDGYPVTATLEDGRISGRAACNTYGGAMVVTGERFELDAVSATEMACEPAAMAAEAAYVRALRAADRVRRDAARLVLTGPGTELVFTRLPTVPARALVDTSWTLETLIVGETATSTTGTGTLRLRPDGSIEGSTGCRAFSGRYVVRGDEVVVTRLSVEDERCPADTARQDERVVDVVGDGFRASVDGDVLTLTSGRGGLVFRAS